MSKDNLLNALKDSWTLEPVTKEEVTIQDVSQLIDNVSPETIRLRMNGLVLDGMLASRDAKRSDGNRVKAYKPAEGVTIEDLINALQ